MLEVRLLGQFNVQVSGEPIDISSRPAQSLLAYLLLNAGTPQRREMLAGLFWPEATESNARSSLRHALWRLRKAIGTSSQTGRDYLIADDFTIAFDAEADYWLDAATLDRSLNQSWTVEDLLETVSLYQGDLLPGFYEDWVALERDRLRSEFEQKMNTLVTLLMQGEQWDQTIYWGERWIACGEATEPAYQALMIAHAGEGDMARVAETYKRCVKALNDELGVQPSKQTKDLYKTLEQGDELPASIPGGLRITRDDSSQLDPEPSRRTNINLPLTTFIGREAETQEIKHLISKNRLLTLTGPGGCGKTRIALNVGDSLVEKFADGVWLIELGSLMDPELVAAQTANAVMAREEKGRPPTALLLDYLHDKHSLLLFDNCEHLIEAVASLIEFLLTSCKQLRVLATSREALNIAGEMTWIVPSLAFPDPDKAEDSYSVLEYDAVRLFVDRAGGSRSFDLTEANAGAVALICQRLDGIPLAVELAAARLKALSVEQIASRLDDRFQLLTGGSRTALPRQRTLRATMDWSYDLLPPIEQAMFRQLAVFAGGWTLEGAEGIAQPAPDSFLPSSTEFTLEGSDSLDLLTNLMDKSLVVREGEGEGLRYRMLETVREFGLAKLREAGEESAVRDRHLEMFMRLAERLEPLLHADQVHWLDLLESELDNIRAAIAWSMVSQDDTAALALRVQAGLRLMGSLGWFFERHNRRAPLNRLTRLLSLSRADAQTSWRAKALNTSGFIRFTWGDYPEALRVLEEAQSIARNIDDKENLAWALSRIGAVLTFQGHYAEAPRYLEEGLGLAIELGVHGRLIQAWCMSFLGDVYLSQEEIERAQAIYEESVAILRELENQSLLALSVRRLGLLALRRGELDSAQALFEESLLLNQIVNHTQGVAACFAALAGLAVKRGSIERAAQLCGAVEGILEATAVSLYQSDQNEYDQNVADLYVRSDDQAIAAAWSAGQSMSLGEAVAYALEAEDRDGMSVEGAQR